MLGRSPFLTVWYDATDPSRSVIPQDTEVRDGTTVIAVLWYDLLGAALRAELRGARGRPGPARGGRLLPGYVLQWTGHAEAGGDFVVVLRYRFSDPAAWWWPRR